ncbi:uncharacterized protein B0H64DRAFT_61170 [Chaetomium fimeti]|uniref:MFS transporter n=1 Tax=Chaetomium fimeti TaxID=1854472 RepID=A0AAE0LMF1_9PEZI|nr:hypothetical protein B0H64DRAFT_61170 [Chaetomium fimeti]
MLHCWLALGSAPACGRAAFCTPLCRARRNAVGKYHGVRPSAPTDQTTGWPQTLALYYLVETFGADLGMALMSTITRSVAKAGIRARLQNSPATEKIIMDAMRDLNTVGLLDQETRAAVLAAFEHAMHSSFVLPCVMAAMVIVLAAAMNIWPRKPDPEEVASEDHP